MADHMSAHERSETHSDGRSVKARGEAAEVQLAAPRSAVALVMDLPALIETIYSYIPVSARCGPVMLSRLAAVSQTFRRFSEDEALWIPIAHQCLPITGVTTADEKVAQTRDVLAQRVGSYRRLVLAYARANSMPVQMRGLLGVPRPRRFGFNPEQPERRVYLVFEVFDRIQNRVVASSGGLLQMGQGWERPNSSNGVVPHLKLGPDAVVYQAAPHSMTTCRYWTDDRNYSHDPAYLFNELVAPKDWIMGRVYVADPDRHGLFVLWESMTESVAEVSTTDLQFDAPEATLQYGSAWSPLAITRGQGYEPCDARLSMVLRWDFAQASYTIDPASFLLELGLPLETSWHVDLVRSLERIFT